MSSVPDGARGPRGTGPRGRRALETARIVVAIAHPDLEPREDWQNLNLLTYRTASAYHWEVDNFLRDKGLHPRLAGEVDDAFLMVEAVARGGFVAFVPSSVARPAIRLKRVKALAALQPTSAGVHALYHDAEQSEFARTAVEKLIEHAREQLEQDE